MQNRTAIAIASVALFFSLTGAGMAAQHFLITSKRQIAPWVRAALKGDRGPRGSVGPHGAAGATGAQGAAGTFSTTNIDRASSPIVSCDSGSSCSAVASCPTGSTVISGGLENASKPPENTSLVVDAPYFTTGWQVWLTNNADSPVSFRAVALCAS